MEGILQAHRSIPARNTLLLRRTFPELEQSLLLYFRRDVPRELYKSFNDSKHVVDLAQRLDHPLRLLPSRK